MKADTLLTGISQLVTARGASTRHGAAMREVTLINDAAFAIESGHVAWIGRAQDWDGSAATVIDLGERAVVPALIDPHTHAVWAGDRLMDFEARTSGKSYEQILRAGGGIRSSIRATAASSRDELVRLTAPRVARLLRSGASTIEIKSGYGFAPAAEIAMLEAIDELRKTTRARILATLLIHVPPEDPGDRAAYIREVCASLIPTVAARRLATALDVFVEQEAWHADEAETMLRCAVDQGLAIKLHTEQFQRIGGLELGIKMRAVSVDHLEACLPQQLKALAESTTIATLLPGVSLHLGIAAAPGRRLIDAGAAVAVGTDLNPGSSPVFSAAMALSLAVRINGLTAQEALVAGTLNAACALGLNDTGRLEPGVRADFLVLKSKDWRDLVYTLGDNPVAEVWVGGERATTP